MSPQADYVVSNGTGAAVRSDINGQLAAIVSNNSGASAPATTYAYMLWADTSTNLLKLRNGANSAWITVGDLTAANLGLAALASPTFTGTVTIPTATISTGAGIPLASAASPAIYFTGDTNTGIYSPGADQFAITTGGSGRVFVDSSGRVGLGTSSPGTLLDISATGGMARIGGGSGNNLIQAYTGAGGLGMWAGGSTRFYSSANITFSTNATIGTGLPTGYVDAMTIDSSGRVGIGDTAPGYKLVVAGEMQMRGGDNTTFRIYNTTAGFQSLALYADSTVASVNAGVNNLALYSAGTERARIDGSGRLLVGTSSARANFYNSTTSPRLQVEGTDTNSSSIGLISSANGVFDGANLLFAKSRGTTVGSNTIVQSGDSLGFISFQGSDGSEFVDAASIGVYVDGTPGSNDMPGRLVFSTTTDGASSPTERARITNAGYFKATSDGTYNSATGTQHEFRQNASGSDVLLITSTNASLAAGTLEVSVTRAANTAYNFFRGWSSGFGDLEFNLRGDGNAFADGTWTGGGADYAEYFEWSDGNPDEEDRRGISVVLDGDQIRPAVDGEDPIGVISGNPSVVGDAAWNKWSGKYLRDDYGTYIQEDYEVVNDEGETVIQQRRKLNPAYDPDQEYVNREDRPEWDCVGLMGKLRIRKGQPTGSRWIKMRDISDSVEEWLVR